MVWKFAFSGSYDSLEPLNPCEVVAGGPWALLEALVGDPLPPVERREGGKPFFPDRPDLCFNLSHSHGLALCVLSDKPVGCDIELIRPRSPNLARYALDDKQYEWFQSRGEAWGDFCALWTLKEARVKCTGQGLRLPPRDIMVPLIGPGEQAEWEGFTFTALAGENWRGAICEAV